MEKGGADSQIVRTDSKYHLGNQQKGRNLLSNQRDRILLNKLRGQILSILESCTKNIKRSHLSWKKLPIRAYKIPSHEDFEPHHYARALRDRLRVFSNPPCHR